MSYGVVSFMSFKKMNRKSNGVVPIYLFGLGIVVE